MITVTYSTIDRFRKTQKFKTLTGARKFAQKWVGETPELGSYYAVSGDGVGKVTVDGATLLDLFPKLKPVPPTVPYWTGEDYDTVEEANDYRDARAKFVIDDDIPF